jgi:glycosyltransferase involved in cell wall biosynthesis
VRDNIPKVTVIIPVKNGMPWLSAMLSSLECQTFKDFEVLVWENGSTDKTLEVLNEWIPSRLEGCVISNEPLPYDRSLARLVERASSKYIARLDADDIAVLDRLEKQVRCLDENPDIVAVGGQMDFIDENDVFIGKADFLPHRFESILSTMLFHSALPHSGITFRRDVVLQVGNYNECQPVEDLDLWLRLARRGKLINLPDVVTKYRIHPGSVTATAKKAGHHTQRVFACLRQRIPELYAIDSEAYGRLLEKRHPLAIKPLYKVARSIAKLSGVSIGQILKNPAFLHSARCLTGKYDVVSKLVYFYLGRDPSVSLARQVVTKVSSLSRIRTGLT